jgi:hypothetical protein
MRPAILLCAASLVLALTGSVAAEPRVTINGVNVGLVRDTKLTGCTVDFDGEGNIRISAPGYTVVTPGSEQAKEAPRLSREYFLATQGTTAGATQYVFHVYVNGSLVRSIKPTEIGLSLPLNQWLEPGKNQVGIRAYKEITGQRVSKSPDESFTVLIGEGSGQGSTLVISSVLVKSTRTAAEMMPQEELHTIVAQ